MPESTLVYFGPTIKDIGLQHNAFFSGQLPPQVQDKYDNYPGFSSLFVTLDQFAKVNHELKKPNSPSSQVFKHFLKK